MDRTLLRGASGPLIGEALVAAGLAPQRSAPGQGLLYRLYDLVGGWALMDTVGNAQLGLPDVEACFRPGAYDCGEVDHYLRNVSLFLLRRGGVIADGDTLDGPGGVRWRARGHENGLADPPRRVLRLTPEDGAEVPAATDVPHAPGLA